MLIDKDGKLGGKFSVIDLVVILAAVVAVFGIAARFLSSPAEFVKETKDFEYVIEVDNVRIYTIDALKKMGKVTDKNSEYEIGEIVNVEVKDVEYQSTNVNGELVYTTLPERYSAIVTLRSTGKESKDGYFTADNAELSVGRTYTIYSKWVTTSGEIKSVVPLN